MDGGLLGSFDAYDLAQAQQAIADLQTSSPFLDLLGIGIPEAAGLFAEIGGLYAEKAPTGLRHDAAGLSAAPARVQPSVPGHQPGAPRPRLRPGHLAGRTRTAARQRRRPRGVGRSEGLGRRRRHAGEPPRRDLRAGAEQRGRVVLPEAAHDRHQRRRSDDRERRRQLPRPAPLPHAQGQPAAVRDRHRPGGCPRSRRGPQLPPPGADDQAPVDSGQPQPADQPPRPAHGGAEDQRVPEDRRAVPRRKVFGEKPKRPASTAATNTAAEPSPRTGRSRTSHACRRAWRSPSSARRRSTRSGRTGRRPALRLAGRRCRR